jgi:cellulose synthase (UDP-forming)
MRTFRLLSWLVSYPLLCIALVLTGTRTAHASLEINANARETRPSSRYLSELDELSALWSHYKYAYIRDGRVISPDEGQITTSEGQSYGMLRAVWQNDHVAFERIWRWTQRHLQTRRDDHLFSWKWYGGRVLDRNSATDADSDIALALILAANRFSNNDYRRQALEILNDIWNREIIQVGESYYVTAGNWAPHEEFPTIHVAYFAPYAYDLFSHVDSQHPWRKLIESSYRVLHWIYFDQNLKVPPEIVYLRKGSGELSLKHPRTGAIASFSYDAFPLFWRLAMDSAWNGRSESPLRAKALSFFEQEWKAEEKLFDRYSLSGQPLSYREGLPLYANVQALALVQNPEFARALRTRKLDALRTNALSGRDTPYYLQNWLWFGRAYELGTTRTYGEFLGFLRPFDFESFSLSFPWVLSALTLALYFLARFHPLLKWSFLGAAFSLCGRYLYWRLFHSLNFLEPSGPVISILLWAAEFYCFSTVALLILQVGLSGGKNPKRKAPATPAGFAPSVDVFIPIYSESCDILDKTLIAACAMRYPNKRIHVCDDSHRDEVRLLAESHGASYIPGPRKHAKAGNLNNAMKKTSGELILIFDTDHIPVTSFLAETIPYFADPEIGFIQTPHHFYNEDIFQRALATRDHVPDEQDMFNHGIQAGRDTWGGAFFVGSGAIFRRKAMDELGGFKLMSITEDIHTSQHLHARGWKSAFIDKDLAVGLTAENFASFVVQRRRWMLGCLQIFFKDNPLFCRGLSLRHRLGYFASLYYFFFPIARVIFWSTPLYFLLFHWHPIFSEVSVLLAYLIPSMVALPMMSSLLLPAWPRMVWGTAYETAVSFTLFRSMFDLFLPKNMGFKVTPKGITSSKRSFDAASSKATLVAAAITLFAIIKGLIEFFIFGIEKDAYFFNLTWACINFLSLGIALLIAWEKPQRRGEERIRKAIPFELRSDDFFHQGVLEDISLSGLSFRTKSFKNMPAISSITLQCSPPIQAQVELVKSKSGRRHGFRFIGSTPELRRALLLETFASANTWQKAHTQHARTHVMMASFFIKGIVQCLLPARKPRTSQHGVETASAKETIPAGLIISPPAETSAQVETSHLQ